MKYLNVDAPSLTIAIEEMELLTTELSGSQLVEAPDVGEQLQEEILKLEDVRGQISEIGMDRETAVQIDAAVEGFLYRNPSRNFTRERSIEGLSSALEEIDEKRGNILQRFIAWLRDRFNKSIEWLKSLFGEGGKAAKVADKAKELAEDVSNNRNTKAMAEVIKDPKAGVQTSRIDPADEKSGTFEDFAEALEKNMEPIKGDVNAMYERVSKNQPLRIAVSNQEAIKSFFDQMEKNEGSIEGVRNVIDNVSGLVRNVTNVGEAAQKIKLARAALYQVLGGSDESVLDQIRQQQFTDKNDATVTTDTIAYDKLIEAVTAVTKNISVANSATRIRALEFLGKAVTDLGTVAENNAIKRLDPADRDMLLTALNALLKDVSRYQSASMENWNYALQLYNGCSAFFSQELSVYYRVIAAMQRAASQTLSGGDREALFTNLKKQGFNVDLSEADLQRRGVGTECFAEIDVRPMIAALESLGLEEFPEFPFQEPLQLGGGLLAALEAEEQAAAGDGKQRFAKLREWMAKVVEWFKNLFTKTKADATKKVEQAKEIKAKQDAAVKTAVEAKQASKPTDALRPEIKALFEKYVQDRAWWKDSGFSDKVVQHMGNHFATRMAVSPEAMKEYTPAATAARDSAMAFVKEIAAATTLEQVAALAGSKNWENYGTQLTRMTSTGKLMRVGGFMTLAELVKDFSISQQSVPALSKLTADMSADLDIIENAVKALHDKMATWENTEANSPAMPAASKFFKHVSQLTTMHARNLSTVADIEFCLISASILSRQEKVQSIFAAAKKADANAPVYDSHELVILMSDDVWGITSPAMESLDVAVAALEAYRDVLGNYEVAPYFSSVVAGLESEEGSQGVVARVKAFFARIIDWIKSLFAKQQEVTEQKVEVAKEHVKQREEKVAAVKAQTPQVRPEVKKVFDDYLKDPSWYKDSKSAQSSKASASRQSISIMYSAGGPAAFISAAEKAVADITAFVSTFAQARSAQELGNIDKAGIPSLTELVQKCNSAQMTEFKTLEEIASAYRSIAQSSGVFNRLCSKIATSKLGLQKAIDEINGRIAGMSDAQAADAQAMQQAANAALDVLARSGELSKVMIAASLDGLMGAVVNHATCVKEIFADYNNKQQDDASKVAISDSDITLLVDLPIWKSNKLF